MIERRHLARSLAFSLIALAIISGICSPLHAQSLMQNGVIFHETAPLADEAEITRRTHTPLYAAHSPDRGQTIDVSKEIFTLYVPAQKPPRGYALLVFIPPWDRARLPPNWASVLDDKGMIFVSASNSGNDTDVASRRIPLALIAAYNVAREYNIDPSRVFIGGFSGGARVAMRVALAYPDVFRGALLSSGSDPIGTSEIPIPPADLFRKFQEQSQLFYIVGDNEPMIASSANASLRSMDDWCMFNTDRATMFHTGHDVADAASLDRGLTALLHPATPDPGKLSDCRAGVQSALDAQMLTVRQQITAGDKAGARQSLDAIDAKYGGLAAPQSLALDAALR